MNEEKRRKDGGEETKGKVESKAPAFLKTFGRRNFVIIGLTIAYIVLVVAVPPGDAKALVAIMVMLVAVMAIMHVDSGLVKFVRNTNRTTGLTMGAIWAGVGIFALVVGVTTSSVFHLLMGIGSLLIFGPLLLYKIMKTSSIKGLEYVNPIREAAIIIISLGIALFLFLPVAVHKLIALVAVIVGWYIYGKGSAREKRKAELERLAVPA